MPAEILGAKNGKTLCKKHRIKAVLLSGREVLPQTQQFYRRHGRISAFGSKINEAFVIVIVQLVSVL